MTPCTGGGWWNRWQLNSWFASLSYCYLSLHSSETSVNKGQETLSEVVFTQWCEKMCLAHPIFSCACFHQSNSDIWVTVSHTQIPWLNLFHGSLLRTMSIWLDLMGSHSLTWHDHYSTKMPRCLWAVHMYFNNNRTFLLCHIGLDQAHQHLNKGLKGMVLPSASWITLQPPTCDSRILEQFSLPRDNSNLDDVSGTVVGKDNEDACGTLCTLEEPGIPFFIVVRIYLLT